MTNRECLEMFLDFLDKVDCLMCLANTTFDEILEMIQSKKEDIENMLELEKGNGVNYGNNYD